LTAELVVGEYGTKRGKESGVGKGCAKGVWNVAEAFARPVLIRVNENGAAMTDWVNAWPVGRE
jgi:hypothetical protein